VEVVLWCGSELVWYLLCVAFGVCIVGMVVFMVDRVG